MEKRGGSKVEIVDVFTDDEEVDQEDKVLSVHVLLEDMDDDKVDA